MASVLVVDDEEAVRSLLRKLLEREGHEVVVVSEGEAALTVYAEKAFDLVITDLVMPKMNGLQAIGELLGAHPTARIIAISGGGIRTGDPLLASARDLGACVTLAKPFDRAALLQAVVQALEGS